MATEQKTTTQTLKAGADLRTHQFKCLRVDTAAAGQCILASASTQPVIGILGNKPNTGEAAEVITEGFTKGMAGAAIATAGLELMANASGKLITATATNMVAAISLESAGADGDIVEVAKVHPYIKA
jgi:hypothetical protein